MKQHQSLEFLSPTQLSLTSAIIFYNVNIQLSPSTFEDIWNQNYLLDLPLPCCASKERRLIFLACHCQITMKILQHKSMQTFKAHRGFAVVPCSSHLVSAAVPVNSEINQSMDTEMEEQCVLIVKSTLKGTNNTFSFSSRHNAGVDNNATYLQWDMKYSDNDGK